MCVCVPPPFPCFSTVGKMKLPPKNDPGWDSQSIPAAKAPFFSSPSAHLRCCDIISAPQPVPLSRDGFKNPQLRAATGKSEPVGSIPRYAVRRDGRGEGQPRTRCQGPKRAIPRDTGRCSCCESPGGGRAFAGLESAEIKPIAILGAGMKRPTGFWGRGLARLLEGCPMAMLLGVSGRPPVPEGHQPGHFPATEQGGTPQPRGMPRHRDVGPRLEHPSLCPGPTQHPLGEGGGGRGGSDPTSHPPSRGSPPSPHTTRTSPKKAINELY